MKIKHQPVLAQEIYDNLPETFEYYMDGTFWHAWHCNFILSNLLRDNINLFEKVNVVWVDRDSKMLSKAMENTLEHKQKIKYINSSYSDLDNIKSNSWVNKFDIMLLDLWVNMEHFKDPDRWFSIKYNWLLDMRYDTNSWLTAKEILKKISAIDLAEILSKYWDFSEKYSLALSECIVQSRTKMPLETTFDLIEILRKFWMNSKKMAVVFQCIRIYTNNELWELEKFLINFKEYLNKWWLCMIITYHSIEDRIVKYAFKELIWDNFSLVNKKVIKPTFMEIQSNKAARSAKLRIIRAN